MPRARKSPDSRRFAGPRHEREADFVERGRNSGGNFRLTMDSGGGDTRGMVVEFPILDQIALAVADNRNRNSREAHPFRSYRPCADIPVLVVVTQRIFAALCRWYKQFEFGALSRQTRLLACKRSSVMVKVLCFSSQQDCD